MPARPRWAQQLPGESGAPASRRLEPPSDQGSLLVAIVLLVFVSTFFWV